MLNFHDYQVHQGSPLPISAIFYPEMKMIHTVIKQIESKRLIVMKALFDYRKWAIYLEYGCNKIATNTNSTVMK